MYRFPACFGFGTTKQNSPCGREEAAETPEVMGIANLPTCNFLEDAPWLKAILIGHL